MDRINRMAQQTYRQIQGVRQVANSALSQEQQMRQAISCCQGPQSNNVVDTPTNRNGLPFPIESAIETTQPVIGLTNQSQDDISRAALDNWVNEVPNEQQVVVTGFELQGKKQGIKLLIL